jgi:TP53 regulating kinase-like protein
LERIAFGEARLIRKGAEASLFATTWHDLRVIVKIRLPKSYRIPELDAEIRSRRTIREAQLMREARLAGVPVPALLSIDPVDAWIVMQHVEGVRLKEYLESAGHLEGQEVCETLGRLIGRLHLRGVIHGDLTTSNMVISSGRIFFVDFGLGELSQKIEAKGVDLHLLRRALSSTHFRRARELFEAVLKGYAAEAGREAADEVAARVKRIERRGRYVPER